MSRQPIASAVMCALAVALPIQCMTADLIHAIRSTRSLAYACEVKNVFPGLALGLVRPFLSQMIVVFLDHSEAGIVPIVGRFQSGDAGKGKCQRLLRVDDR